MYTRRFVITSLLGAIGAAGTVPAALARQRIPIPQDKPPVPRGATRPPAILVLDPGHGGRDPGAIGMSGTHEKDVTLSICQTVRDILRRRGDIEVHLTRDNDTYIPLGSRVAFAHEHNADLFISIHADAAPNHSAHGLSAYSRSDRASDSFARQLADRENQVDTIYGFDASATDKQTAAILIDLARRHSRNASLIAKRRIVTGMGKDIPLLDNPMRSANFAVLRSPSVPSVLIETGFLTNPHDERELRNPKSRAKLAQYLAEHIAPVTADLREA